MDRHALAVMDLRHAVLASPGAVEQATREAAHHETPVPEPWVDYVAKVRDASYLITDADIEALIAAGCSEDAIFELTLAAAIGAATRRLDAGLRAVREAD
ncbi:hypothetical protein R8Z50_29765 [Longispora sp. K20-0274]|uniref:hypothetical protein n=1 Tax=Longispora sp. K20-0274 TaxID=3088255 RepID=UPI00399B9359